MIAVTLMIPTIDEMSRIDPKDLQQKILPEALAEQLAKQGITVIAADHDIRAAPDGSSITIPMYLVLGDSHAVFPGFNNYYPTVSAPVIPQGFSVYPRMPE